jgi:hypothetical protein
MPRRKGSCAFPWLALSGLAACLAIVGLAALLMLDVQGDRPPQAAAVLAQAPDAEVPPALRARLRAALEEWLAATHDRDFDRQMSFYASRLRIYYDRHNVPSADVLAARRRESAAGAPPRLRRRESEIALNPDGTATVRFRPRHTAPQQELTWARTEGGWRIVSERNTSSGP